MQAHLPVPRPAKPPYLVASVAGERVIEIRRNGVALDPDATSTVATNDFMACGGDGYRVFAGKKPLIEGRAGKLVATEVIDFIAARGVIASRVDGRLRALDP